MSVTMTPKHLCILVLAIVAASGVVAQSEDIPLENDNQFPPDTPAEPAGDMLEGSGDGTGEEPPAIAETIETTTTAPPMEEVQPTNVVLPSAVQEDQSCPTPCVCHYEGGTENFIADCSRYNLTEFPSPIDPKTTTLNIQYNKLTEIPKEVSSLKNLKVLNAENNQIMDLALGSVSDLPELKVLKLGNNRLIEYPKDLKNSLSLTKLEELDLGGNDMRGELKPEILSNLQALRVITLPTSTPEQLQELCNSLKDTLNSVCIESCNNQLHECTDKIFPVSDEDLLDILPNTIPYEREESDPDNSDNTEEPSVNSGTEDTLKESLLNNDTGIEPQNNMDLSSIIALGGLLLDNTEQQPTNNAEESVANKQETNQNMQSRNIENPDPDVTVGATTAEGKTGGGGGVDKSVIGIVVAAMVVVVAGITIKKNWSSIKRKFSSSPRPADRAGANANGTTLPEEVPLQDKEKSPV